MMWRRRKSLLARSHVGLAYLHVFIRHEAPNLKEQMRIGKKKKKEGEGGMEAEGYLVTAALKVLGR